MRLPRNFYDALITQPRKDVDLRGMLLTIDVVVVVELHLPCLSPRL